MWLKLALDNGYGDARTFHEHLKSRLSEESARKAEILVREWFKSGYQRCPE